MSGGGGLEGGHALDASVAHVIPACCGGGAGSWGKRPVVTRSAVQVSHLETSLVVIELGEIEAHVELKEVY